MQCKMISIRPVGIKPRRITVGLEQGGEKRRKCSFEELSPKQGQGCLFFFFLVVGLFACLVFGNRVFSWGTGCPQTLNPPASASESWITRQTQQGDSSTARIWD